MTIHTRAVGLILALLLSSPGAAAAEDRAFPAHPHDRASASLGTRPTGIYLNAINLPSQDTEAIVKFALPEPAVAGANVIVRWSDIDQGPGATPRYDFSSINRLVRPWNNAGKTVNLLIWGSAENADQQANGSITPAYVRRDVPTVTCRNDAGAPMLPVPVFYDPDYQREWFRFLKRVYQQYSSADWLGYIRTGIGVGAESYPTNGIGQAECANRWQTKGYSVAQWRSFALDYLTRLDGIRGTTPTQVTINQLGTSSTLAPELRDARYTYPHQLATRAAELGIGVGAQGLTAKAAQLIAEDRPCNADFCSIFQRLSPRVPDVTLELQTATQTSPFGFDDPSLDENGNGNRDDDPGNRTGTLRQVTDIGLDLGARVLELYAYDFFIANPDVPSCVAEPGADPCVAMSSADRDKYQPIYRSILRQTAAALPDQP